MKLNHCSNLISDRRMKKQLLLTFSICFSFFVNADESLLGINISDDEFKKSTWITTKRLYAKEYYQDANVWVFFGISHYWKEDNAKDDSFRFSIQGNVAFANPNESEIYFLDNHSNRFKYAEAYMSKYQRGNTPYGYRMGIGCGSKFKYNCMEYLKTMEDKELVWRFYNGGRKIADIDIPKPFRSELIAYFDEIQETYK